MKSSFKALSPATWSDFEQVMGCNQGGNSGCWCTWWRLPRSQWEKMGRDGRKQYIQHIVNTGQSPGIVAFDGDEPYGWCALAPSQDYPVICRSSIAKPSLIKNDWFISCFFVKAGHRRIGAMSHLLSHAIEYAVEQGAWAIEACPRDAIASSGASDLFVGKTSIFLAQGFKELCRRRFDRPLLRLELKSG